MWAVWSKLYGQDHFIKRTVFNLNGLISNERPRSETACIYYSNKSGSNNKYNFAHHVHIWKHEFTAYSTVILLKLQSVDFGKTTMTYCDPTKLTVNASNPKKTPTLSNLKGVNWSSHSAGMNSTPTHEVQQWVKWGLAP